MFFKVPAGESNSTDFILGSSCSQRISGFVASEPTYPTIMAEYARAAGHVNISDSSWLNYRIQDD